MKTKLIIFALAMSILIPYAIAQNAVAPAKLSTGAGIFKSEPDSPIFGLDVAIDNVRLLMTFNNTAKAELGLQIAQERMLEARDMIIQNKLEAAQRAQIEHNRTLSSVETAVRGLHDDNATKELEYQTEIEDKLLENEHTSIEIENDINTLVVNKTDAVNSILAALGNNTQHIKIEIESEKNQTKIQIHLKTGKNETDVNEIENEFEHRLNATNMQAANAQEQIKDAQEAITELQQKLNNTNITGTDATAVNGLLSEAGNHLANAKSAFNSSKFGEAFGQATAAEQLSENAKRIFDRSQETSGKRH